MPRKTFSDFRLTRLEIGEFVFEETFRPDQKDARIRFYFRNASDKDPPPGDATAAARAAPDRVSLSLFKGTQRIVIPVEHVFSIVFSRQEGKIVIETDGWAVFEECVKEGGTKTMVFRPSTVDPTGGELSRVKRIEAWLNLSMPLTEPKWTKGNLKEYIGPESKFHSILHIMDADPCPTLQSILERWTKVSTVGKRGRK